MKVLKWFTYLVLASVVSLVSSCGSDDPSDPNNPDKEISPDAITAADLVGAWELESEDPYYLILDADRTGATIVADFADGKYTIRETPFTWRYRSQVLTIEDQVFTVVSVTSRTMVLIDDEGYKERLARIKKSDIPGMSDDGDDEPGDNPGDTPGVSDKTIKTLSAEPSAYRAVLKGQYSGGELPENVGFQYSYEQSFPQEFTKTVSIKGKFGGFETEIKGIVDLAKIYYRAYAEVNGKTLYGETKSFDTPQGTYKIDGVEYKFIKVTGLASGTFSMMQTELPPNATLEIDGQKRVLDSNTKDPVTKGETRELLNFDMVVMRYPSAQEWMYAASGGKLSAGYTYSGGNSIDEVACYTQNSNGHARTPGKKKANELGFYDMSGNYAELTAVYDEDIMAGWRKLVKTFTSKIQNVSALYFNTMWNARGGAFGGYWGSTASKCLPNSSESVSSYVDRNRYDGNVYALRLVYSRPD